MHFTKRRPELRAARALGGLALFIAGASAASCSSNDGDPNPSPDPSPDAAPEAAPDADTDAGVVDAQAPRDAWVDVTALPVTCTGKPCATALVTTLGAGSFDNGEGFCALLDDGTVACWGANGAAQLGRDDGKKSVDSSSPARVEGLSNIVAIDHTCALDKDGAVWCWGTGPFARDDEGALTGETTTERTPVKLELPAATQIAVGYGTACAVIGSEVHCWGSNTDGQLSPPSDRSEAVGGPRPMVLPAGAAVRALSVATATFVLRDDGSLVTWGANPTIGRVSPMFPDPHPQLVAINGVFMADLAENNACAIAGGTGWCWGAPVVSPRPDNGSVTERAVPAPVVAPEPLVQIATTRSYPLEFDGWQKYRWCGSAMSGAVYCWGSNESGQAGDGTQAYAFEAVKVQGLAGQAAQVKTTPTTTCALLTNGKIQCWGSNFNGQLGNKQIKGRSFVPVEVVLP